MPLSSRLDIAVIGLALAIRILANIRDRDEQARSDPHQTRWKLIRTASGFLFLFLAGLPSLFPINSIPTMFGIAATLFLLGVCLASWLWMAFSNQRRI